MEPKKYHSELLDQVDAVIFSGTLLIHNLEELEEYVVRWNNAINNNRNTVLGISFEGITLAEFLKDENNQKVLYNAMLSHFRENGEWGRRGLATKIATYMGISSAHVGQIFLKRKPITESFIIKLQKYFKDNQ